MWLVMTGYCTALHTTHVTTHPLLPLQGRLLPPRPLPRPLPLLPQGGGQGDEAEAEVQAGARGAAGLGEGRQ